MDSKSGCFVPSSFYAEFLNSVPFEIWFNRSVSDILFKSYDGPQYLFQNNRVPDILFKSYDGPQHLFQNNRASVWVNKRITDNDET